MMQYAKDYIIGHFKISIGPVIEGLSTRLSSKEKVNLRMYNVKFPMMTFNRGEGERQIMIHWDYKTGCGKKDVNSVEDRLAHKLGCSWSSQ
jgi:hypothetical protein